MFLCDLLYNLIGWQQDFQNQYYKTTHQKKISRPINTDIHNGRSCNAMIDILETPAQILSEKIKNNLVSYECLYFIDRASFQSELITRIELLLCILDNFGRVDSIDGRTL